MSLYYYRLCSNYFNSFECSFALGAYRIGRRPLVDALKTIAPVPTRENWSICGGFLTHRAPSLTEARRSGDGKFQESRGLLSPVHSGSTEHIGEMFQHGVGIVYTPVVEMSQLADSGLPWVQRLGWGPLDDLHPFVTQESFHLILEHSNFCRRLNSFSFQNFIRLISKTDLILINYTKIRNNILTYDYLKDIKQGKTSTAATFPLTVA